MKLLPLRSIPWREHALVWLEVSAYVACWMLATWLLSEIHAFP